MCDKWEGSKKVGEKAEGGKEIATKRQRSENGKLEDEAGIERQ